jgi:hypothetical protein
VLEACEDGGALGYASSGLGAFAHDFERSVLCGRADEVSMNAYVDGFGSRVARKIDQQFMRNLMSYLVASIGEIQVGSGLKPP